jgi:hypothetical protein
MWLFSFIILIPLILIIPVMEIPNRHHQGLPPFFFLLPMLPLISSIISEHDKAKSTIYGLTDQRAIIISGAGSRSIKSYYKDIRGLERIELTNDKGDILFARPDNRIGAYGNAFQTRQSFGLQLVGFIGIPNPREVENLIITHILDPR